MDVTYHYGSQIDEHNAVRSDAGVFDVSHMNVVDLRGEDVQNFLRYLLANDVAKLDYDQALYTAMLNEEGGILDDLIVYKLTDDFYRCVMNSATKEKDLAWVEKQAQNFKLEVTSRPELSIIAIQGPNAREKTLSVLSENLKEASGNLKPFRCTRDADWLVARTGYTGEDGFEVILPASDAPTFWKALLAQEIMPCGLGARDTLRLEAGLNLYGSDMDEGLTPLESNIAWTVAWAPEDRDFIGKKALDKQKTTAHKILTGIVLDERGVLREGQKIFQGNDELGEIVSGTFSPTMKQGIAFARINSSDEASCTVDIRGKRLAARIVKLPFVRKGKILVERKKEETNE